MIKAISKLAVTGVVLGSVMACSIVEEKRQAYRQAESSPALNVPQNLDTPSTDGALTVPETGSYEAPSSAPPAFVPK